ncbi:Cell division protein FtsB [Hathewaya proteolytica DSM 3090]|uniref:Cell division protein FtsB n=1 Tax=Hathewaya proteolytica DSM 3090 TaxID=1121331 RepID=A0A1M6M9C9_9CLOT|nr:septum formation initiator family protein [Hathewaya proteolytica]SHJ80077.1 Cell division protein FtsB [Hathewaya proteolytica DSM 3090]
MKRLKKKNILYVVAIVYVLYTFASQAITLQNQKKEIAKYNQELQRVKAENQQLQDDASIADTDEYSERLARERLGLVKDGEDIIIPKK